ncbi:MAG: lipopolysaccharide transport periplasmic protein LptA [Proteobacteria bacterium]|nr:lipopolysaccharide transport periplasmic protein LptA [Pseudomonadota bacterium]
MPSTTDPIRLMAFVAALCAAPAALALSTDRSKPLNIDANYQKSTQSRTGKAGDPDITRLDGNVAMTQGSMQAHADHATVYQNPGGVADANGNYGSLTRVILTGTPAHLQQVHDGDCGLMSADADTIDYDNLTGVALLTGNVTVVQHGKGEFHGQRMRYNTNTGEMESGDASASSRVHMVMQPRSQQPEAAANGDCTKAAAAH